MQLSVAAALLAAGLALPVTAEPVRVSIAGQPVEADAQVFDGVVVGAVLPMLQAVGAEATYLRDGNRLSVTAADGTKIEARAGSSDLNIDGASSKCRAMFQEKDGQLYGPLADLASAAGLHVAAAPGELRLAHRLASIEAHAADEAALIHVQLSGPAEGELKTLEKPLRAYADFPGVVWTGKSETLEMGGAGGLKRVRWSLNERWPPVTRIVVDLEPGAKATMSEVAERLFMIAIVPVGNRAQPQPVVVPSTPAGKALSEVHIVIDPAAGGDDAGVRGSSISEKTVVLDIAVRLAVQLMDAGARVTLTRTSDFTVTVPERARKVREARDVDLVLTLRCGDGAAGGCGVMTSYSDDRAKALATVLQGALVADLGAKDLGVGQSAGDCLPGTDAPSAACFVGHLGCSTDEKLLASQPDRERSATALAKGMKQHFSGN